MNERALENRIAVVTGSSRGLGRAIAVELGRQGAFVVLNYPQHEEDALKALSAVEAAGGRGAIHRADVSRADAVKAMFDEVARRHGPVDILVNNAGITRDEYFLVMRPQSWDQLVAVHLDGAYNCAKAVVRGMCARGRGVIVNIGSGSALVPMPGQVNYSATKAGLLGFTKSLARELAPKGVRVLHVAPGFFKTDMTERLAASFREETYRKTPLGRWGLPVEIAEAVAFLVSDEASWLTGQSFVVDGGRGTIESDYGFE